MNCRACENKTTPILDFGKVALAGAFLKAEGFAAEKRHPLTLQFCEKCLLLQTGESISPETLFQNYFYFSSATETMKRHFEQYAKQLVTRFKPASVLEIGCNDGVLLRPLHKMGIKRLLGVDPAVNVTPTDLPIVNAFWGKRFASQLGDKFDLILANNVFAHIEDINGACEAVAMSLEDGGSFVFEVNCLDELISGLQYDWAYHEHLFYYSMMAMQNLLARHGLEIYDLQRIATHAGSIRYFAGKAGQHAVSRSIADQRGLEKWMGLDSVTRFQSFAKAAFAHRAELQTLVRNFGSVAGYGACGRTNTMLQFCGFGPSDIQTIVDDAPAKHGYFTPGTHIPITKELTGKPECLIVFAWSFLDEITPKLKGYDGAVYVPLPMRIYQHQERKAA